MRINVRADRADQYRMILTVVFFQLLMRAPLLIILLKPSNPKHQKPRGGPLPVDNNNRGGVVTPRVHSRLTYPRIGPA